MGNKAVRVVAAYGLGWANETNETNETINRVGIWVSVDVCNEMEFLGNVVGTTTLVRVSMRVLVVQRKRDEQTSAHTAIL